MRKCFWVLSRAFTVIFYRFIDNIFVKYKEEKEEESMTDIKKRKLSSSNESSTVIVKEEKLVKSEASNDLSDNRMDVDPDRRTANDSFDAYEVMDETSSSDGSCKDNENDAENSESNDDDDSKSVSNLVDNEMKNKSRLSRFISFLKPNIKKPKKKKNYNKNVKMNMEKVDKTEISKHTIQNETENNLKKQEDKNVAKRPISLIQNGMYAQKIQEKNDEPVTSNKSEKHQNKTELHVNLPEAKNTLKIVNETLREEPTSKTITKSSYKINFMVYAVPEFNQNNGEFGICTSFLNWNFFPLSSM